MNVSVKHNYKKNKSKKPPYNEAFKCIFLKKLGLDMPSHSQEFSWLSRNIFLAA